MQNRFWYLLSKKLGGEASEVELSELEHLLADHPEWMDTSHNIDAFWNTPAELDFSEGQFVRHLHRMEEQGHDIGVFQEYIATEEAETSSFTGKKRPFIWWSLGIAAGFIAVLLAVFYLFIDGSAKQIADNEIAPVNEVVTHRGNRSKVVLPDGSQVWLNSDSRLEYGRGFGSSDRNVSLSGEAYFDVVKNTALPFIISTKSIRIKVTGTAFNVKAYPGEKISETALIRGKVEVTVNARPDEKYILKPNEKIVIRDEATESTANNTVDTDRRMQKLPLIELGHLNFIENDTLAVETSWLYNRLIFDDESFEDIARKMERWYGVEIHITDSRVAATRFTYQIKDETISQALSNMQYAARFHFNQKDNHITITR